MGGVGCRILAGRWSWRSRRLRTGLGHGRHGQAETQQPCNGSWNSACLHRRLRSRALPYLAEPQHATPCLDSRPRRSCAGPKALVHEGALSAVIISPKTILQLAGLRWRGQPQIIPSVQTPRPRQVAAFSNSVAARRLRSIQRSTADFGRSRALYTGNCTVQSFAGREAGVVQRPTGSRRSSWQQAVR